MNFDRLKEHSADNLGSGTDLGKIELLESTWGIKLPKQFRNYLLEVGYAEIYGDEIYSIYEVPDKIACLGLHWTNKNNEDLKSGYIQFFSNDIDGVFYIKAFSGKVFLNSIESEYAESFEGFVNRLLDE